MRALSFASFIALVGLGCSTSESGPTATPEPRDRARASELSIELPQIGNQPFELAAGGVAIRFQLEGALAGVRENRGDESVFAKAAPGGGDIVVRRNRDGFEDFVHYDNPPVGELATYQLKLDMGAAGIRLVDNAIEVLDDAGAPRLRMAPPYVIDAKGERHAARTTVRGCAIDTSQAPPWDRPITSPGNASCAVDVQWPAGLAYPVVLDPAWSTTANWSRDRAYHEAVTLPSGRIFVAGGRSASASTYILTSEIFDPTTNTWALTGSVANGNTAHALAALPDGRVLYAGQNAGPPAAEVWSPSTGTWSATGAPKISRLAPSLTTLVDGRVFMFGGREVNVVSGYVLASGQFWSPTTGTWSDATPAPEVRQDHSATLLKDGRVLIAGGRKEFGDNIDNARIFDPTAAGSWSTPISISARSFHTGTLLNDGRVLLAGGYRTFGGGAELLDPTTKTVTATKPMVVVPYNHTATLLPDGDVLITGGGLTVEVQSAQAQVFSPTANLTWSKLPNMLLSRTQHTASALPPAGDKMRVLVAGGSSTVEIVTGTMRVKACASNADCMTGNCEDGICCDTTCGGCMACVASKRPGPDGECNLIPVGKDPDSDCPTEPTSTCGKTGLCDGKGSCALYPAGVSCGAITCNRGYSGTYYQTEPLCDGKGKCEGRTQDCNEVNSCTPGVGCAKKTMPDPPPPPPEYTCNGVSTLTSDQGTRECAPYRCSGSACRSVCTSNSDCVDGFVCNVNTCGAPMMQSSSGGCAMSPQSPSAMLGGLAALVGLAGFLRRRRR